ncbi:MAG: hypothetical protein HC902_01640 [Calothrix sp. SM1_5_4]|nr:hypothetical protein [Calothrix sp. SM1_5_4]
MKRARAALKPGGQLLIMETFTDMQKHEIGRFCLDMISFYFTCMANGKSRMYRVTDFRELLDAAGFEITDEVHQLGLTHSVLHCRPKES